MRFCGACTGAIGRGITRRKVAALVAALPGRHSTLGADVMVELSRRDGRAEFEETIAKWCGALPFGYLLPVSVFAAAGDAGLGSACRSRLLQRRCVQERMAALRALATQKSETHRRSFIGRELEAITLHTPEALRGRGRTTALTENFLPVEITGAAASFNELVRVRVTGLTDEGILA